MAQNLKLEIFKIAIRKRNSRTREFLNFKELFESMEMIKKKLIYSLLLIIEIYSKENLNLMVKAQKVFPLLRKIILHQEV